jgi:hypothetical protein
MGGGKSDAGGGAHDYYGTIAGLVCAGPVDELVSIIVDKKTVWPDAPEGDWKTSTAYAIGDIVRRISRVWICVTNHTSSGGNAPGVGAQWAEFSVKRSDVGITNPLVLSVVGYGTALFYWGTDTQTLENVIEPTFAADHPAYRRQCFVILKDFLFGRERTSAPNVEVVVRRKANQSIITGAAANLDASSQANPLGIVAESITHPVFGLGQAATLINAPSWGAVSDSLTADAPRTHLSPVLSKGETLAGIVGTLMPYYDGWMRWNRDGVIEAGQIAHNSGPPTFTAANTISTADLVEEISFDTEGWTDTVSEVNVRFTDRDRAWKDSSAKVLSLFNQTVTGEPKVKNLDRPWITRAAQAAEHAAEFVRMYSEPGLSGSITVRLQKCEEIKPGDLFTLEHSALGLSVVCRCTEKGTEAPPGDRATLRFESERAFSPAPYQPQLGDPVDAIVEAPEVVTLYRFVSFNDGSDIRLLALAARKKPVTTWMRVHLRQADGTLFYELGRQASWEITGTLQQNYPDTNATDDATEDLRVTLNADTVAADLERIQATQTADAINDNSLLMWIFNGSGSFEILTVKEMRMAVGESFYRFKVRRNRFGTSKLSFTTGHTVFIGYRSDLVFYNHSSFRGYADAATVGTFRLQPRNIWTEAELADTVACPDRTHTFGSQFASLTQLGTVAGYYATSATSLAIGTGSKTLTTQAGLAYVAGARVRITSTGTPTAWMEGTITSYTGTSMVVSSTNTSGSGTYADWAISLAGEVGSTSATTWATLTDGATITWAADGSRSEQNAKVTLGGNRTLSITSPANGMAFRLLVKQDGTGGRTLTLPGGSKAAAGGGGAVTLSAGANAQDLLEGYFDGTNYFWSVILNYT